MKVEQLLESLNSKYPYELAESWDNVGLLFGSRNNEITKVLTSLNIDLKTCQEAVLQGCNVIVSHHPLLSLNPLQAINKESRVEANHGIITDYYEGKLIEFIIKNDLNIIAMHTNADFANAAVSKWIAEELGYDVIGPFINKNGSEIGVRVKINNTLESVLKNVRDKCNRSINYLGENQKLINEAVIIGGSGSSFLKEFLYYQYDLFLTGDLTYHNYHDTLNQGNGACLIDISHHMEIVFIDNVLSGIEIEYVSYKTENVIKQF